MSLTILPAEPRVDALLSDVIGWEPTRGEWPRGMSIDPSGKYLYAANQNTDTIAVLRIQHSNGKFKFSTLVHTRRRWLSSSAR